MLRDLRDTEQDRMIARLSGVSFQADKERRKGDRQASEVLGYVEQLLARRRSAVDRIP